MAAMVTQPLLRTYASQERSDSRDSSTAIRGRPGAGTGVLHEDIEPAVQPHRTL